MAHQTEMEHLPITSAQLFSVLQEISKGNDTVKELMSVLNIKRSSVSVFLSILGSHQLLSNQPVNKNDKREKRYAIEMNGLYIKYLEWVNDKVKLSPAQRKKFKETDFFRKLFNEYFSEQLAHAKIDTLSSAFHTFTIWASMSYQTITIAHKSIADQIKHGEGNDRLQKINQEKFSKWSKELKEIDEVLLQIIFTGSPPALTPDKLYKILEKNA